MSESRRKIPEKMRKIMDDNYRSVCQSVREIGYQDIGESPTYYFALREDSISSDAIIKKHLEKCNTITVLDLGTGEGGVPKHLNEEFKQQVSAYGITAENSAPKSEIIFYGNIEFLSEIKAINEKKFDVIFASQVLMHVTNPLKVITDAYTFLKPGGVFLIKGLVVRNLEPYYEDIIRFIQYQGHDFSVHGAIEKVSNERTISSVFIRKRETSPHTLEFPCDYEETVRRLGRDFITYKLNKELEMIKELLNQSKNSLQGNWKIHSNIPKTSAMAGHLVMFCVFKQKEKAQKLNAQLSEHKFDSRVTESATKDSKNPRHFVVVDISASIKYKGAL